MHQSLTAYHLQLVMSISENFPYQYMIEYFNSAHIHVMGMILFDRECWGKIFGVQRVAENFIFHINLSSCPLPSPHLNRGHQYPKSSIVVDSDTFRFSKYRSGLCVIQRTEIQIYRALV